MYNFSEKARIFHLFAASMLILALGACGSNVKKEVKYPTGMDRNATANANDIYDNPDSVFGKGGTHLFGDDEKEDTGSSGIGVNSFLWRASLDTVSFMPLASADPFGGVILTDWYSPADTADERFKLNVFILDRQLRSDGIQVKVFRQIRKDGTWRDSAVADKTGRDLEDTILTRARQMRIAQIGSGG